ncbi:MAG: c-type cytochrome [Thermosynechococcaceae cyanobacterium]
MKKLLSIALMAVAFVTLTFTTPAMAADAGAGAGIFNANCAVCHMGGNNTINPAKTLKQDDLDANGKNTSAAIVSQVTNGNGAMPAFGASLSAADIENVAAFVLDKAASGWAG